MISDEEWDARLAEENIKEIDALGFKVGDVVCSCKFEHLRIVALDAANDMCVLEDGFRCSLLHCLDKVPHPEYDHPTEDK